MRKLVLFIAFLIPICLLGIGSFAEQVEVFTASDTLLQDEFSKTCIVTGSGITMTLMEAEGTRGRVTFVNGTENTFSIDPNGTDHILFTTCTQGDQITSPTGATSTGACVTLIDYADGIWGVVGMNGTFTDGD